MNNEVLVKLPLTWSMEIVFASIEKCCLSCLANLTRKQNLKIVALNFFQVFEAVIAWVNYDRAQRENYLPELMEHVRLPLLSRDYLVERVETEPLIKRSFACKDYLIEAMKYHLVPRSQRMMIQTPRTRTRTPVGLPKVVYVVGGQAPKAIRR